MSGFGGFGTGNTGGLFGANKPATTGFTGFAPAANTTAGLTFGTNTFGTSGSGLFAASQPATGFGTAPTAASTGTGFAFGNQQAPAAPQTTGTGFSFGTQPAGLSAPGLSASGLNVPGLGAPALGAPALGAPALGAPGLGAPGLGAPGLGTPGFGTSTAPTGFGTATPALNFGAPQTTASTLSFGTGTTPFNFGLQTPGAVTTTTTSSLGFGTAPPAAAVAPVTQATQAAGFTFSQPTTTSALSFGAPTTTGLTLGTTPGLTAATTTTPTLSFGLPVSSAAGFSLGSTGGGIFGAKTTDNWTLTTATTTTSIGLGGVDNSQSKPGLSGTGNAEPKQVKDNLLPEPILQSLNKFQKFTKKQKSISVEISHGSSKPLKKVQEDTEALESLLATITSGLTRNAIAVDRLKMETAQGLHQAEMAQRTHETPPGLEYDNSAPSEYFSDLVTKFETDTIRLRVQIEASEKHLRSLTQSTTISPQELTLAMRRLHETLVVLAAKVQTLHTTVQSQKEQYKNVRRVYLKDDSTIFEHDADEISSKKQTIYSLRSLTGPSPFSETPSVGSLNLDGLAMLTGSSGTSLATTTPNPGWMTSLQGTANTSTILPTASNVLTTPQPVENTGFQLSKPPVGNKRNKR